MTKATKPPARDATQLPPPRRAIPVDLGRDESDARRNYAGVVMSPELAAFRVVNATEAKSGLEKSMDTPSLLAALREQAAAASGGDLSRAEAMLMCQATALQTLFARLAERGMGCNDAVPFEINMRMALRAQAQCRVTLETLANIKNPPTIFARQANIAHGPQQVNNETGTRARAPACPQENEITPSKLLEARNGERMDTGTASAPSHANQKLETVGAINRAANARGKAAD